MDGVFSGAVHLSELAGRTSQFDDEIGFFQGFLPKNHLLPVHYLGFDLSAWIVLINSEILITSGRVWPALTNGKRPLYLV